MKHIKISLYLILTVFVFHSCKEETKKVVKAEPVVFKKEGELSIFKQKTDSLIASFDIEIAESEYETQTGLMYRKSMKADRGMLFIFPEVAGHSFYMKNTEFPLDIIFIKEDMTIANYHENAQPLNESSLPSQGAVQYVLELNAGLVQNFGIQPGDSIAFTKL
ncbi:DUF192 domain-containing protein [Zobellia uliginosa]|uniref:DUF192 domain-containing protein n=1 Tax=Zobellia uliginosa TaxID=143224 RepID=UPI0026E132C0|nr:DUF192 domain-containing protein [Zobellia uliginosa]MDO6517844.1 DUF192 domain-containing protein [Zobellia uliginosa]